MGEQIVGLQEVLQQCAACDRDHLALRCWGRVGSLPPQDEQDVGPPRGRACSHVGAGEAVTDAYDWHEHC